ncbi:MAG: Cache 3/Cache 2 fusion domain-containing protein [Anaerolineales bacterium]|nr:Cache 3/Cache 2 fusion domain-containing protein [Anaerolineales bacterium]
MLRKIPTFWLMVFGLMLTSAITLGLMAVNAIRTTGQTVEREQILQLRSRAGAHALSINERLHAFENATQLVATQAKLLMRGDHLSPEEVQARLQKYQRDADNVFGLDLWYETDYKPRRGDDHISNVYLNKDTPLTPQLEYIIAATEDLDPLFASIHESGIGAQWLYLTLPSGMMRLYPYTPSSGYGVDWQPQTITFYTVADQMLNPDRKSVWTAPYGDYAGAGLMVTNSYPVYDKDTLIGVMSNDFTINDLQKEILGFKVGTDGFAFLLDGNGNVIAHKNYAPEDTPPGADVNIKLVEQEPYLSAVVAEMFQNREGAKTVTDASGKQWVVVYAPVATTNWHLALMQPRDEIIQPATDIANQLKYVAVVLVLLALIVSVVIARWISLPVMQLSKKARLISSSVDAMDASIEGQSAALVDDTDTSNIHGTREIYELTLVFGEMVATLRKRINELGSIYILGQTIAAAIEYEKTLDTVLHAVERTVKSDFSEIYTVQNGKWTLGISSELETDVGTSTQKFPMPESLMEQIISQKSSLLIKDLHQAGISSDAAAYMDGRKIYSLLAAPLTKDDKPVGLVSLENCGGEYFTVDDQRQLNRIAALASIAINNAIQVRQREQALKEQIRELKIEIDQSRKQKEVSEIVESDYFQALQKRASEIRARSTGRKGEEK